MARTTRRRSRTRRMLKWVFTAASVLLLGLWGVAWLPGKPWGSKGHRGRATLYELGLDRGYYCFYLQRSEYDWYRIYSIDHPAVFAPRRDALVPNWVYLPPIKWEHSVSEWFPVRFSADRLADDPNVFVDHAHAFQDRTRAVQDQSALSTTEYWSVFVAAWVPFILLAIPAAFLWYRDRGFPPGRCRRCGYDLTGNISGRCPEFGEPI